ncbi:MULTISPECIES: MSHA fimbrial ATPase MshE [Aeromonas]|jgi:MSHA biogenesis protein MshE|uniref:MSHA biogenesis protein MshE n=1 Tax=Aeromonas sobria TaxID=646 RepID=A0A2N3IQ43_AERSO|nr:MULTISPECIES: MSHA fimbrial ATPase MshE [Aeromonas]ATL94051.1 MSHA biogenesis protein MshE [Aeromonas sp. CU5]EKP0260747.1 MSHA fimbrial ATPase MshE [Aeromonas sobria]ELM3614854.1 MSHA fimbrial ATPase MshE [Aeromonas sobria]MCX7127481.1 MSHA fimbrial ATPase MshE [Aeromonas sp.]PKQ73391.1 MSHA biogenesis protein MshE [Aeromonas sobria]
MAQPRLKMRLGDLLVQEQIISDDQLQLALQQQRQTGRKLGSTLIDLGFISEVQLLQFLARQLNVPFFDLNNLTIDAAAVPLLPEVQARRYRALAVNLTDDRVTVAMSDPADLSALDAIAALLSPRIMVLAVAREGQLLEYFDRLYRRTREIESFAEQLQEEYQDSGFELGSSNLGANDEGEATVAKLLRSLFEDAVQVGASDIHIEPDEKVLRIRQRIDGILHENILNEVRIAQALVLRLKLVAGLDISEKRLPQDGRFNMKVRGRDVDVRMSTMPVQYGESVVMRLLDQSSGILSLTDSGMPPDILTRFRRQLHRPHGMILVTGPTGSGKTTTLYGALSELNQASNKIITVEDPVEYRLSRVNQVQVNPKIGLTFSQVLRSTLRQDPDILLVGEMRDNETVEIGLRGAITGHLVLTTLHTNDAITSALRLIDMGAPGYLVASALRAVVAQRLVRRVCEHCVEESAPDEGQATWLTVLSGEAPGQHTYHKGRGCQSCNFTGYSGRIGVYELLELDQPMMDALRRNDAEGFAKAARQHEHFRPLALTALDYARQGITSVDEVLRLAEDLG